MSKIRSAFVLAAGRGERLKPLTDTTPKPLVQVRGRPLLDYVLENLKLLSLERVVLNAWWLADQIEAYAKGAQKRFPFEILVSRESDLLGTGGGLKKAWPLMLGAPFVSMNGDCLWRGDLKSFVERSEKSVSDASWWLTNLQEEQTKISVENDLICGIGSLWGKETKRTGCFTGIQYFQNLDVDQLPDKGCIIRQYWIPKLKEKARLRGDLASLEQWTDIGTPERLRQVERAGV